MKSKRFRPSLEPLSVRILPSELMAIVNCVDTSNTLVVNDSMADILDSIQLVEGPNGNLTYVVGN